MSGSRPTHRALALVALAALLATACAAPPEPSPAFRIEYRAVPVDGRSPTQEDVSAIAELVGQRLDRLGLAEIGVRAEGADRIVVEGSPSSALDEVRALAGTTGRLDVVPLGQTAMAEGQPVDLAAFPPLFSGDQVAGASVGEDQAGQPVLDLTFHEFGARAFAAYTTEHVGDYVALVLDGNVLTAPVINEPIVDGRVQVSTVADPATRAGRLQRLVVLLNFGPLPFPLQEVSLEQR